MLYALVNLVAQSLGSGLMRMNQRQAGLPPEVQRVLDQLSSGGLILSGLSILIGVVIIFGAVKMQRLRSYGLAMAASILAMIPCISPCCLLGLPIGIWAVVVLMKPEVKSQFQ